VVFNVSMFIRVITLTFALFFFSHGCYSALNQNWHMSAEYFKDATIFFILTNILFEIEKIGKVD